MYVLFVIIFCSLFILIFFFSWWLSKYDWISFAYHPMYLWSLYIFIIFSFFVFVFLFWFSEVNDDDVDDDHHHHHYNHDARQFVWNEMIFLYYFQFISIDFFSLYEPHLRLFFSSSSCLLLCCAVLFFERFWSLVGRREEEKMD